MKSESGFSLAMASQPLSKLWFGKRVRRPELLFLKFFFLNCALSILQRAQIVVVFSHHLISDHHWSSVKLFKSESLKGLKRSSSRIDTFNADISPLHDDIYAIYDDILPGVLNRSASRRERWGRQSLPQCVNWNIKHWIQSLKFKSKRFLFNFFQAVAYSNTK